ncbi:MAG: tetratricopeptide (TPR) repeat protein, partial [Bradymonadia bacterium]
MTRLLLIPSLLLIACAPDDVPAETYLFSEGPLSEFNLSVYVDEISTRPELDAEKRAIIDQIVTAPEEFLTQRPPTAVLNEAELVFFAAGRTFELLEFYAAAVERGVEEMRPRRAWLLERLGLHEEALAQARQAIDVSPESAEAHFVLGFVLGQSEV